MAEQNKTGAQGVFRGIETVAQALRFEDFPTDKQDLYYAVGDIEIEDGDGRSVPVRDVLDRVPERDFLTPRDALHALCRAIEKKPGRAA